jgi:DNA-binding NarL/FixJ family response regulator
VLIGQALEHLLQADFEVVGRVADGRALLEAAEKLSPDVAVVDIGMPLLNGLDAAERLKALQPGIKIIFLTQNREPRFAAEAFRRKASGYVLKDAAAAELTTAIREALRGKTYVSPSLAQGMRDEESLRPVTEITVRDLSAREREVLQLLAEGKAMKRSPRFSISAREPWSSTSTGPWTSRREDERGAGPAGDQARAHLSVIRALSGRTAASGRRDPRHTSSRAPGDCRWRRYNEDWGGPGMGSRRVSRVVTLPK